MVGQAGQLLQRGAGSRLAESLRPLLKYGAALLGQASMSLFHFALNIVLVRRFDPHDYGVFALAFVAAMLGASVTNALAGTPVSVYTPGLARGGRRGFLEMLLTTVNAVLVAGILLLTTMVTVAMAFPLPVVLAFSAFVAMYSARQYSRSFGYARLSPQVALGGDLAYVGMSLLLLGTSVAAGFPLSLPVVLGALALGNLFAIALEFHLLSQGQVRLLRRRSLKRYAMIWKQSRWALIGAVTTLIASQAHSFLVSIFSGPAAYAPLAAGFVLFGPIRIGLQSWLSVMRPEMAVAIARRDRASMRRIQRMSVTAMLSGMVAFGLLLWVFWHPIERFLYASRYGDQPMGWIVAGWCVVTFFTASMVTPSGMLQSLKAFRVLAMGTVYSSMLSLAAVALLLSLGGPAFSILGVLMAEAFLAAYLIVAVHREVRSRW